jgi:hypothetical protein
VLLSTAIASKGNQSGRIGQVGGASICVLQVAWGEGGNMTVLCQSIV